MPRQRKGMQKRKGAREMSEEGKFNPKGCKYCERDLVNTALGYDLDGEESALYCRRGWLQYVDGYNEIEFMIKINYCPMCGRKLEA